MERYKYFNKQCRSDRNATLRVVQALLTEQYNSESCVTVVPPLRIEQIRIFLLSTIKEEDSLKESPSTAHLSETCGKAKKKLLDNNLVYLIKCLS